MTELLFTLLTVLLVYAVANLHERNTVRIRIRRGERRR